MLDQLKRLAIFSIVSEAGSFSESARRLKMTPSNVSRHIEKLEDYLGATLFFRSTRRLVLSPDGRRLLPVAQELVRVGELALKENDTSNGKCIDLNIVMPEFIIGSHLFDAILNFPSDTFQVSLNISFLDRYINIGEHGFDIGIMCSALPDSSFRSRILSRCEWVLCAAPSYLDSRDAIKSPSELSNCAYVSVVGLQDSFNLVRNDEDWVVSFRRSSLAFNSFRGAMLAVRNGFGLQRFPAVFARRYLERGLVVSVLSDWHLEKSELSVIWPADHGRPSVLRSLVAHMAAADIVNEFSKPRVPLLKPVDSQFFSFP